jgi:glucose/arabinose dehydrogenase
MKKFVVAGALATAVALAPVAFAQTPAAPQTEKPKTATQTTKPKATRTAKAADQSGTGTTGHAAPKEQPATAEAPSATDTAMTLGTVRLPKGVKADGKDLASGTYTVRLTADEAKPDAKGSSEVLERWVEFVKGGQVAGREVVSIVPNTETKLVQKDTPPRSGGAAKVETLKGGDYIRVWFNKGGNYYLIHLGAS